MVKFLCLYHTPNISAFQYIALISKFPPFFYLQEAEKIGYTVQEFGIATEKYGKSGGYAPISWLKTDWPALIKNVVEICVNSKDEVGDISFEESKAMMIECEGDVDISVQRCVKKRKEQVYAANYLFLGMLEF